MRRVKDDQERLAEGLPETDFAAHALQRDADFHRMMGGAFSILIVGIVALLLREAPPIWTGATYFFALACFIYGAYHCLQSTRKASKLLWLSEVIAYGIEAPPNLLRPDESISEAFERLQTQTQGSCETQIQAMSLGAVAAFIGLVWQFWDYAWRAGAIALALLASLAGSAAIVAIVYKFKSERTGEKGER